MSEQIELLSYLTCPCGFIYDKGLIANMEHRECCPHAQEQTAKENKAIRDNDTIEIVLHVGVKSWEELKRLKLV